MTSRAYRVGFLLGLVLALAPLGPAYEARAEVTEGIGVILAKDLVQNTITFDGQRVYRVLERTRIHDANGQPLTLEEVPVAVRHHGLPMVTGDVTASFEAVQSRKGGTLTRLVVGIGLRK